jgi:hypothetical protein
LFDIRFFPIFTGLKLTALIMKKSTLIRLLVLPIVSLTLLQSCKEDKTIVEEPPIADQTKTFEFESIATATAAGWTFKNRSEGQTSSSYGFDNDVLHLFTPYSGSGIIFAGFEAGEGILSVWAISPSVTLQNGDKITFYTRTLNDNSDPANVYPDRLQLRLSLSDKDSVGNDAESVGLFKIGLVDVNPNLSPALPDAYPDSWTKFEGTVSGLNKPTKGRYAFRYFVEDGGSAGSNSLAIALDKVTYTSVNH